MELTHSFTVPATVERTWQTFMDLQLVGGCFPGATVTEVTDDGFAGTVKVKLGPIALTYAGTGAFVERDDGAHRAVIEAKGKDKRGNGTAGATVTIQLEDAGGGGTRADVRTDLSVTGKPAQFGRGVMQDVSDKLLGQFVGCIEGLLSAQEGEAGEPSEPAPPQAAQPDQPAPPHVASVPPVPAAAAPVPPVPAAAQTPSPSREPEAALDLGSAVLPVLVRSYGKQAAAAVVTVLVVVMLLHRRARRRAAQEPRR